MLADRESDISNVIAGCSDQNEFDWIIRGGSERVVAKSTVDRTSGRVTDQLREQPALFQQDLSIRSRQQWGSNSLKQRPGKADRDRREVTVEARSGRVCLNDPRPGHRDGLPVNVVLVSEVNPPDDVQPIEWVLLTSLPVKTKRQVEHVITYYQQRWVIELYFKVLKSGCRIESRRFEHIDRFLPALALYMIIAWRSLYVCRVSRTHAEQSCELAYTKAEWQSVWAIMKHSHPPHRPPRLMDMTRLVAQLGGYIDRKNSGPPGPQSMWLALQRMHDIAHCWLSFGPGAQKDV
jgi:hypothetical protein